MGTYSQFRIFDYSKYQKIDRAGVTLDDIYQATQILNSQEISVNNPLLNIQEWEKLIQITQSYLEEGNQPFHLIEAEPQEDTEGTYRWEVKATDALIYLLCFPNLQLWEPESYESNPKTGTTLSIKNLMDFMPAIDFFELCQSNGDRPIKTIQGGCYLLFEELDELRIILQNIQNTLVESTPISRGIGRNLTVIKLQDFLVLISSAQRQNLVISYEVDT